MHSMYETSDFRITHSINSHLVFHLAISSQSAPLAECVLTVPHGILLADTKASVLSMIPLFLVFKLHLTG